MMAFMAVSMGSVLHTFGVQDGAFPKLYRDIIPTMENKLGKHRENQMEARILSTDLGFLAQKWCDHFCFGGGGVCPYKQCHSI